MLATYMLKKSQMAHTAEAEELYGATAAPGLGPFEDDERPEGVWDKV